MHTVYHTPDGRVLAVLAQPDPNFELTQRLAGIAVQTLQTDEFDDADPERAAEKSRVACEQGRVSSGRVQLEIAGVAAGGNEAAVELVVARTIERLAAEGKIAFVQPATKKRGKH